jgi:glycosyltransferase involved in cell wall biosynthesis
MKKEILFLIKSEKTPSSRIRVIDLKAHLAENNVPIEVREIPKNRHDKKKLFNEASEYPVTVLQKRLLNYFEFKRLRRHANKLVFDFDDAIYCRNASPSEFEKDYHSRTRQRLFKRTVRNSDLVIAANTTLAEKVREFAPDSKVEIIPSSIECSGIELKKDYNLSTPPVIGWVGTSSTLRYLEYLAPVFRQVQKKQPFTLRIIADKSLEIPGVTTEFVPWSLESQYPEMAKFDLGIMPLSEDPFSKGKAAYKLLQYLAVGLPTVSSPVGMNRELIGDNQFGLKAETPSEFADAIFRLLNDQGLRENLGQSGHKLVKEKYSTKVVARKFAEILGS